MVNITSQSRSSRSDKPVTLVTLVISLFLVICTFLFFSSSAPNSLVTPETKKPTFVVSRTDSSLLSVTPETKKPKVVVTSTDSSLLSGNSDDLCQDTQEATFYDDPTLGYSIDDKPIENWDEKRRQWLETHPSFFSGSRERILMVTGSQPGRCKEPGGDNLLLRLFKNKVDYSRIQGHQIYYSNTNLHPKMGNVWVKLPVIYAAMLAHPESEWIWWVDSDAVFTDMGYSLPVRDYEDYNMVVSGWPNDVYGKKSYTGLNAGVFLIRNCQWAMDFLREWASTGPISPDFEKRGIIYQSFLSNMPNAYPGDQSSLVYLLVTQREKWGDKILLEGFYLQTFFPEPTENLENIAEIHARTEGTRRRAEVETKCYAAEMERNFEFIAYNDGDQNPSKIKRRPFVTHFCSCGPCGGPYGSKSFVRSCAIGIEKALNFADNQVLRNYGFVHKNLSILEDVSPLPFDA